MKRLTYHILTVGINVMVVSGIYGNIFAQGCDTLPVNARLSCTAWVLHDTAKAHNDSAKYKEAIDTANVCIALFSTDAVDKECHFRGIQEPLPPVGSVNDSVKKKIHENGLENDVGTCWYIKGLCFKEMFLFDTSNKAVGCSSWVAFKTTQFYTYARTWDPRGWFWSPSTGVAAEMTGLLKNTNLDTTSCGTISIGCSTIAYRFRNNDILPHAVTIRQSSGITYINLQGRVLTGGSRFFRKTKLPIIHSKHGKIANQIICVY